MTTQDQPSLMDLVDDYAEARHTQGHSTYNTKAAAARQRVVDYIASIGAGGVSPLRRQCLHQIEEPQEPAFYTVFASHNGGAIPLPGYSNETEKGVKDLVLTAARKEGYRGTVAGRLLELGWWIGPVYSSPPSIPAGQDHA
ncbi:hypothetical protein GCM10027082_24010 [Comamonas humi]